MGVDDQQAGIVETGLTPADFLRKPFSGEQLTLLLGQRLARHKATSRGPHPASDPVGDGPH
jgi:hypothetical protein